MTQLKKPVRRRIPIVLDNRREPREQDQINVTLYPNGTTGFRSKRGRHEWRLTLAFCFRMAMAQEAARPKPRGARKA